MRMNMTGKQNLQLDDGASARMPGGGYLTTPIGGAEVEEIKHCSLGEPLRWDWRSPC
jgi:hypothetical protein